jgi:hypothetical protein
MKRRPTSWRVKELLRACRSWQGATRRRLPVMALAQRSPRSGCRYLHAEGAEINAVATNGTGYTALTGAVAGGAAVVEWLTGSGGT